MNAASSGFGIIVPFPRVWEFNFGDLVYIDDDGSLQWVGNILNDEHFKKLVSESNVELDTTPIIEEKNGLTAAFASGNIAVQALNEEDCSRYNFKLKLKHKKHGIRSRRTTTQRYQDLLRLAI